MEKPLINSRKRESFEQLEIEEKCINAYHNSNKIAQSIRRINCDMGYYEKSEPNEKEPTIILSSKKKILDYEEYRRIIKEYEKHTKKEVLESRDKHESIKSMKIRLKGIKFDIRRLSDASYAIKVEDHPAGFAALMKTKLEYVQAEQVLEELLDNVKDELE